MKCTVVKSATPSGGPASNKPQPLNEIDETLVEDDVGEAIDVDSDIEDEETDLPAIEQTIADNSRRREKTKLLTASACLRLLAPAARS